MNILSFCLILLSTIAIETKVTYRTLLLIYNYFNLAGKERKEMKIVTLCGEGSCCPVVKVGDKRVEIGEHGNLCVLTKSEWETLKSKIINKEI